MFEGTGLGVVAWERGAQPGTWKPAKGPIRVQAPDGARDVYGSEGSLYLPKQPAHTLHAEWAAAKAAGDLIIAAAPVITAAIVEELDRRTEAGEDVVLAIAGGRMRIETASSAQAAGLRVLGGGTTRADRLARHADIDGEPYGFQPTYESEAREWQQEFLGSL
jgi:hypothetical protein